MLLNTIKLEYQEIGINYFRRLIVASCRENIFIEEQIASKVKKKKKKSKGEYTTKEE